MVGSRSQVVRCRDDRHGMRPDEIEHRHVPRQLPGRQPPRIAARVKRRGLSADDDVAPPAALLQHRDRAPVEHLRLDAADEPSPVRDRHAGEPERDVDRVCRRGRVHRPQRGRPQPERRDRDVDDRPPRCSGLVLNPVRLGHGAAAVPGRAIGRRPRAAAPDREQQAHNRRPTHYPMREGRHRASRIVSWIDDRPTSRRTHRRERAPGMRLFRDPERLRPSSQAPGWRRVPAFARGRERPHDVAGGRGRGTPSSVHCERAGRACRPRAAAPCTIRVPTTVRPAARRRPRPRDPRRLLVRAHPRGSRQSNRRRAARPAAPRPAARGRRPRFAARPLRTSVQATGRRFAIADRRTGARAQCTAASRPG